MAKTNKTNLIDKKQLQSISQGLQILAFGLIVIFGLRFLAQDIIAPILLALFFTALFSPLFGWFRRRGFGPGLSVVAMILTLIVSLIIFIAFFTWSFSLISDYVSQFVANFKASLSSLATTFGINQDDLNAATGWITPEVILSFLGNILGNLNGIFLYLFIVPVLSILIILQVDSIPKTDKDALLAQNSFLQKVSKFGRSIMIYLTGRLKVNLLTGAGFAIALLFLGVPFPFLWGISTVILCFVPYIGLVLAGAIPTLLAFSIGGWLLALLVIIAICVIDLVAENVLEPLIQGRGNKISAAAMVVAFIFWFWLLGPIGGILSAPLTVLLKLILADYRETAWLASLMEGNYKQNGHGRGALSGLKNFFGRFKVGSNKT